MVGRDSFCIQRQFFGLRRGNCLTSYAFLAARWFGGLLTLAHDGCRVSTGSVERSGRVAGGWVGLRSGRRSGLSARHYALRDRCL